MNQLKARFDRKDGQCRWLCPRCASLLGEVTKVFRAKPFEFRNTNDMTNEALAKYLCELDISIGDEVKISTAAVELRAGYVWSETKEIWLKPQNPRGSLQGKDNRDTRQFRTNRIKNALAQGDFSTVGYDKSLVENAKEKKLSTDKPVLLKSDFPTVVLCHKPGCGTLSTISAIRGLL